MFGSSVDSVSCQFCNSIVIPIYFNPVSKNAGFILWTKAATKPGCIALWTVMEERRPYICAICARPLEAHQRQFSATRGCEDKPSIICG